MKLSVNGTELFFDVVGSSLEPAAKFRQKPTMVVLHGGPGFDHTYLRPWLDPVSEVAQLVYIDERGSGRSARHTHEYYQLGIMADDIVGLCKMLAIERPIVLGQSFGDFGTLFASLPSSTMTRGRTTVKRSLMMLRRERRKLLYLQ